MVFDKLKAKEIKNGKLADLVRRAQNLSRGELAMYDKNYDTLFALCKRVLQLSKQEKEWYVYFYALYDILYLNKRQSQQKEVVKYAEIYYRDYALHMDRELPNYPNTEMAMLNVYIYTLIFEAYYEYYQIDDAKMEIFMQQYKQIVQKYGGQYNYYYHRDKLKLALIYRDLDGARIAAHDFLKYERDIISCYICAHDPYLEYLLLSDQIQQAEKLMLDLLHKNIPEKHQWCYKYCESAQSDRMYKNILYNCRNAGNTKAFHYFYEKYWLSLPYESRCASTAYNFKKLLCAYEGCFDRLEDDLRQAEEIVQDEKTDTTLDVIKSALNWWAYFILLDRSGIHKVKIELPELQMDEEGQVFSLAVSAYMEKKANDYGRRFSQARSGFKYERLKESYQNCILEKKDISK